MKPNVDTVNAKVSVQIYDLSMNLVYSQSLEQRMGHV